VIDHVGDQKLPPRLDFGFSKWLALDGVLAAARLSGGGFSARGLLCRSFFGSGFARSGFAGSGFASCGFLRRASFGGGFSSRGLFGRACHFCFFLFFFLVLHFFEIPEHLSVKGSQNMLREKSTSTKLPASVCRPEYNQRIQIQKWKK
jgi:uncharacterized membrane protein